MLCRAVFCGHKILPLKHDIFFSSSPAVLPSMLVSFKTAQVKQNCPFMTYLSQSDSFFSERIKNNCNFRYFI